MDLREYTRNLALGMAKKSDIFDTIGSATEKAYQYGNRASDWLDETIGDPADLVRSHPSFAARAAAGRLAGQATPVSAAVASGGAAGLAGEAAAATPAGDAAPTPTSSFDLPAGSPTRWNSEQINSYLEDLKTRGYELNDMDKRIFETSLAPDISIGHTGRQDSFSQAARAMLTARPEVANDPRMGKVLGSIPGLSDDLAWVRGEAPGSSSTPAATETAAAETEAAAAPAEPYRPDLVTAYGVDNGAWNPHRAVGADRALSYGNPPLAGTVSPAAGAAAAGNEVGPNYRDLISKVDALAGRGKGTPGAQTMGLTINPLGGAKEGVLRPILMSIGIFQRGMDKESSDLAQEAFQAMMEDMAGWVSRGGASALDKVASDAMGWLSEGEDREAAGRLAQADALGRIMAGSHLAWLLKAAGGGSELSVEEQRQGRSYNNPTGQHPLLGPAFDANRGQKDDSTLEMPVGNHQPGAH